MDFVMLWDGHMVLAFTYADDNEQWHAIANQEWHIKQNYPIALGTLRCFATCITYKMRTAIVI